MIIIYLCTVVSVYSYLSSTIHDVHNVLNTPVHVYCIISDLYISDIMEVYLDSSWLSTEYYG